MNIEPAGKHASTLSGFRRLRTNKPQLFQHLDWTNVQPEIIDELFPIVAGRYGSNPHPPSYLASTALVEQWRKLSKSDQLYKIKQHQDEEKKRAVNEKKAAGRASRARRGRRSGDDLQRTPPKQVTTKKRARRGTARDTSKEKVGPRVIDVTNRCPTTAELLERSKYQGRVKGKM